MHMWQRRARSRRRRGIVSARRFLRTTPLGRADDFAKMCEAAATHMLPFLCGCFDKIYNGDRAPLLDRCVVHGVPSPIPYGVLLGTTLDHATLRLGPRRPAVMGQSCSLLMLTER